MDAATAAAAVRGCPAGVPAYVRRTLSSGCRFRRVSVAASGGGFADGGHLQYYADEKETKRAKKREKLAKSVAKDLAELCAMGITAHGATDGVAISEAADVLLKQLKQMKMEEEERMETEKAAMKKQRKAAEEAMKKQRKEEAAAAKMMMKNSCCQEEDSSSSSESSDSDCEGDMEAVDLKKACNAAAGTPATAPAAVIDVASSTVMLQNVEETVALVPTAVEFSTGAGDSIVAAAPVPPSKIEVCMGGKCKKSGSLQLLEEIGKQVGVAGAVVGCKCMGKCKEGPNIRVSPASNAGKSTRNPLWIGVGLDDIGTIVARFLGEEDAGIAAA